MICAHQYYCRSWHSRYWPSLIFECDPGASRLIQRFCPIHGVVFELQPVGRVNLARIGVLYPCACGLALPHMCVPGSSGWSVWMWKVYGSTGIESAVSYEGRSVLPLPDVIFNFSMHWSHHSGAALRALFMARGVFRPRITRWHRAHDGL